MKRTFLCMSLVSAVASAADSPQQHRGFYLRMGIGPSYFRASSSDLDATISGPGPLFDIAIGGAVAENLVLFGDLFTNVAIDPTQEIGNTETSPDSSTGLSGFGPGIGYYIMPINLYLSLTLGTAVISVERQEADGDDVEQSRSTYGFGTNFMIGKEWWVSPEWGLGVAAQFATGWAMKDKNDDSFNALGFGLAFSATYN